MKTADFEPIRKLLQEYEDKIISNPARGEWWLKRKAKHPSAVGLPHALWMIDHLRENYENMSTTKVHRWFGYLQCLMVVSNMFTAEDLQNHTRAAKVDEDEEAKKRREDQIALLQYTIINKIDRLRDSQEHAQIVKLQEDIDRLNRRLEELKNG
jgi:hypothetical protein